MSQSASAPTMIINYVPGEECRVAILDNGKLEEFHAERADAVSRVNNIYVGKVTNVEAGIQAAFVDFGVEENGFLHVSDLHPRYFGDSDEETTEDIGKKTPRRERPPIQHSLRRGQEVIVQVIKEGVGTKGPTLTSYLSIPGRYLVMMPQMDKVGVSRKVEDDELRHRMREILEQLELPEGFGFILRTAGFDRNKTELKRDLAYLQRLWKDMEARRKRGGNKPRLLYSESDLLVRALRDLATPDIGSIVIDDESALRRAGQFMKIVAPRSATKLMHYTGGRPIFHAFGIEQQIALMHAREVPLPSGGRLVIDETEAIVAIDVNSGKSRAARDAETNAYHTNEEAVEEICRQLKLRDLGGIIINDLIDMRAPKHRKAIEQLFRDRLKRDRAKTTIAAISPFGILEMTRQRMRGSLRSQHFSDCPICHGQGLVQRPASVAGDALRELAVILEAECVHRVELVVSGRVAGELLSNRRRSLNRIERRSGKHVDVRVSDTLALDRFTLYAYDAAGSDVDIEKLPKPPAPDSEVVTWTEHLGDVDAWPADEQGVGDDAPPEPPAPEPHVIELLSGDEPVGEEAPEGPGKKKRRRRRRRRGERAGDTQLAEPKPMYAGAEGEQPGTNESGGHEPDGSGDDREVEALESEARADDENTEPRVDGEQPGGTGRRRRRRRRRGRGRGDQAGTPAQDNATPEGGTLAHAEQGESEPTSEGATEDGTGDGVNPDGTPRKKRRRRRRGRGGGGGAPRPEGVNGMPSHPQPERRPPARAPQPTETTPQASRPRSLYGAARRKLSPSERGRPRED